jgi:putative FmdB family regulatory protein
MPTYDYKCGTCNSTFEFFQSMKDDPMTLCPQCGHNDLKKLVSMPAGLIFKGTGFYQTDYVKKSGSTSASSSNSVSDSPASSSDSKVATEKPKKSGKSNKDK